MSKDSVEAFKEEIEKHSIALLNYMASVCREGYEYNTERENMDSDSPSFPIFKLSEPEFYKCSYQNKILEWLVRTELINKLFNYLFVSYGYTVVWRGGHVDDRIGSWRGWFDDYATEVTERIIPIEFFVKKGNQFIGYHYAPFGGGYNTPLDMNYKEACYWPFECRVAFQGVNTADRYVYIDWSEDIPHNDYYNEIKKALAKRIAKAPEKERERQELIRKHPYMADSFKSSPIYDVCTLQELFDEYFSKEEYDAFVNGIKDAVEKANEILSYRTIVKLKRDNLFGFKKELGADLLDKKIKEIHYEKIVNGKSVCVNLQDIVGEKGQSVLDANFVDMSRYLALIGTKDFAQSFITSEYLFSIFKSGGSIDYTSVACGYFKAVEQLCDLLVRKVFWPKADAAWYAMAENQDSAKNLTGNENIHGYTYLPMQASYRSYCKMPSNMGNLFYFIHINRESIFYPELTEYEQPIFDCMLNYSKFNRNGYFHKDNMDYPTLVRIQSNTRFILYWLLSATRLSDNQSKDNEALGIIDDSFDCMFHKMAYRNGSRYILKFNDGAEKKVIRQRVPVKYTYDKDGLVVGASLHFFEVQDFPDNIYEYTQRIESKEVECIPIVINRENLPAEIYIVNKDEQIEKIVY